MLLNINSPIILNALDAKFQQVEIIALRAFSENEVLSIFRDAFGLAILFGQLVVGYSLAKNAGFGVNVDFVVIYTHAEDVVDAAGMLVNGVKLIR